MMKVLAINCFEEPKVVEIENTEGKSTLLREFNFW